MAQRAPNRASSGWRTRHVQVGGHTVAAHVRGQGHPYYWSHGITSSSAEEIASPLSAWRELGHEWQAIFVDACGHGESTADPDPNAYRWNSLAAELLAVADALGHRRFVVGGTSMGAAVALHAAALAPDRVVALVLVIPPTAWDQRMNQRAGYLSDADAVEAKGVTALAEATAQRPSPPILSRAAVPEAASGDRLAALSPEALVLILRAAAVSDLPDPEDLRRLNIPALILGWRDDPGHPESTISRLSRVLAATTTGVAAGPEDLVAWPETISDFCAGVARRATW